MDATPRSAPGGFGARRQGVTLVKPIVYGTIATYLGKKASEKNTHHWVAYVRGLDGEDLSYFIREVHFILHHSFANNDRVVYGHPFELHESGWGEFEMKIRILFHDPNERPVEFIHLLRFYQMQDGNKYNVEKPVVSEFYDEIIFTDPTDGFSRILEKGPLRRPGHSPEYEHLYTKFSEEEQLAQIYSIHNFVTEQIYLLRDRLVELEQSERERRPDDVADA